MRLSQKLSLSLLLSSLLFGGFAFWAFSGLFDFVEIQFFQPRVYGNLEQQANRFRRHYQEYHEANRVRLNSLAERPAFSRVLASAQVREDIVTRQQESFQFLQGISAGGVLRIFDEELKTLHFSTNSEDVLEGDERRLVYKQVEALAQSPPAQGVKTALESGLPQVWEAEQVWIFAVSLPQVSGPPGILVWTLPWSDLWNYWSSQGWLNHPQAAALLGENGVLVLVQGRTERQLLAEAQKQWAAMETDERFRYLSLEPQALVLVRFPVPAAETGPEMAMLVPRDWLLLSDPLRWLLLGTVFLVLYLFFYLVFNLKAEPEVVWGRRIRRLQLDWIEAALEGSQDRNRFVGLEAWSAQIRDGLGRVPKGRRALVDRLLEQSWSELKNRLEGPEASGTASSGVASESLQSADFARLEALLRQVLDEQRPAPDSLVREVSKPVAPRRVLAEEALEDIEELDAAEAVEELDEIEELDAAEAVEAPEDIEELEAAEAVEEPEDIEELEAAEAVEEPDEIEELEAAEAVEEPEDIEELEAAEAVEEPEDIEELEAAEETGEAQALPLEGMPTSLLSRAQSWQRQKLRSSERAEIEELEALEDEAELEELLLPLEDLVRGSYWSLGQLQSLYASPEVIAEEGDLFQIREEVFQGRQRPADDLGQLLEELGSDEAPQIAPPLAAPRIRGFLEEDLEVRPPRRWRWTPHGFDWEGFRSHYQRSEIGLYRALTDLSRRFGAVGIAWLQTPEEGWRAPVAVGYSDAGKRRWTEAAGGSLWAAAVQERGLWIFDVNDNPWLDEVLDHRDLRFTRLLMALPIAAEGRTDYLVLARKDPHSDYPDLVRPWEEV